MKKIISMLMVMMMSLLLPIQVLAVEMELPDSEKPVIVVEVDSEEEFLNYPQDPNYKYIFILPWKVQPRAACSNCGSSNTERINVREQIYARSGPCPISMGGLKPDVLSTYSNTLVDRCKNCNHNTVVQQLADTYTAQCTSNGNVYEVRKEWSIETGHDLHQIYDYWENPYNYI